MSLNAHHAPLYPYCIYLLLKITFVFSLSVAPPFVEVKPDRDFGNDLKLILCAGTCILQHVLEIPQVSHSHMHLRSSSRIFEDLYSPHVDREFSYCMHKLYWLTLHIVVESSPRSADRSFSA